MARYVDTLSNYPITWDARMTDDVDMVCEHLFDAEDANRGVGWRKYRVTVVTLI